MQTTRFQLNRDVEGKVQTTEWFEFLGNSVTVVNGPCKPERITIEQFIVKFLHWCAPSQRHRKRDTRSYSQSYFHPELSGAFLQECLNKGNGPLPVQPPQGLVFSEREEEGSQRTCVRVKGSDPMDAEALLQALTEPERFTATNALLTQPPEQYHSGCHSRSAAILVFKDPSQLHLYTLDHGIVFYDYRTQKPYGVLGILEEAAARLQKREIQDKAYFTEGQTVPEFLQEVRSLGGIHGPTCVGLNEIHVLKETIRCVQENKAAVEAKAELARYIQQYYPPAQLIEL